MLRCLIGGSSVTKAAVKSVSSCVSDSSSSWEDGGCPFLGGVYVKGQIVSAKADAFV